jgi:hypothetical protein
MMNSTNNNQLSIDEIISSMTLEEKTKIITGYSNMDMFPIHRRHSIFIKADR